MSGSGWGRRIGAALVLAVAATLLASVPPAGAADTWWTPTEELGEYQELALTADGRALAVGLPFDPTGVVVRIQSHSGTWGQPTTLLERGPYSPVHVEVLTHGSTTYVVWGVRDNGSDAAHASFVGGARLEHDTWTDLPILPVDSWDLDEFDAAVTPAGEILAVWFDDGPGPELASARFDGTAWSEATSILGPTSDDFGSLDISIAGDGAAVLTAVRQPRPSGQSVLFAVVDDGTGWGPTHRLSGGTETPSYPRSIVATDGEVVVAYRTGWKVRVARYRDGSWSPAVTAIDQHRMRSFDIAAEPDGSTTIAIEFPVQGMPNRAVMWTIHDRAGTWSTPETVYDLQHFRLSEIAPIRLAIGPDGTAAITTELDPPEGFDLSVIAVRAPDGGWMEALVVDEQAVADVVIDAAGILHIGWYRQGPGFTYTSAVVIPFDDVPPGTFFSVPVLWAAKAGLTTGVGGTDEFQPHRPITRAEAITALWRLSGSPRGAPPSGFSDVAGGAFYTPAVNWGRQSGLTTGVSGSNRFEPDRTITRAELITLLWRLRGRPGAPSAGFADVVPGSFYAPAVDWAKHNGITTGVGGSNRFEPHRDITRAETFTLIYRDVHGPTPSAAVAATTPPRFSEERERALP